MILAAPKLLLRGKKTLSPGVLDWTGYWFAPTRETFDFLHAK